MGFIDKLVSEGGKSYGDEMCRFIQEYLGSSDRLKLTAYTFTELFAFVFLFVDVTMHSQVIVSRERVADGIYNSYELAITNTFSIADESIFFDAFESRVNEYAKMLQSGKEPFDIIEKLNLYLYQASNTDGFFYTGSAVFIGDFFARMQTKEETLNFYMNTIIPFVKNVANNES